MNINIDSVDKHIAHLESELELAYKGQEDFKRIIKDLEAINQEVMDEMRSLEEDLANSSVKIEQFEDSNDYLVDRVEELKTEIQKLNRTLDLKDQIITTYRIENAKCFHENEKLKERIEYLQKIVE